VSKFGPHPHPPIDIKVSLKRFEEMMPAEELSRLDQQGSIQHHSRKKLI
jgi:hypothetical protein